MNIIYIITILAIYTLFMLLHKTEKKQNAIAWIAISTILILCYNIFISIILTFIGILCTLGNLSICNLIIVGILLTIILKTKKTQKYYIKTSDIIFLIVLLTLVIVIAYNQYGFPFNIKYQITDASSHYFFAYEFYEQSTLLYKGDIEDNLGIKDLDFRLPGAYVNEGILFKVFDGILLKTDWFIIFDLFILYLSGILFYYLLREHTKPKQRIPIIEAVISIIYVMGYPLNSMLYGYVYLSLALAMVLAFLLMMKKYEKEDMSYTIILPILTAISFGIFFSYAYFIAVIYIAVIINLIIKSVRKKEKIISEDHLIEVISLIIIPLILGITYFIILPLAKGGRTEISSIVVDGAIYKNNITNLASFIPIIVVGIILTIKNRKKENKSLENNFSIILFILSIIFAIILFIGNKIGKVSEYYFFKVYYFVWPIAILNMYIALTSILSSKYKIIKIVTYSYISIYAIIIIFSSLALKNTIGINDIFKHNIDYIKDGPYILENGEMKILEKIEEPMKNHAIHVLGAERIGKVRWMSALSQSEYLYVEQLMGQKLTIERWLENKYTSYYMAFYRDYEIIEEVNLDENSDKYEILYNDKYGFILKRKDNEF